MARRGQMPMVLLPSRYACSPAVSEPVHVTLPEPWVRDMDSFFERSGARTVCYRHPAGATVLVAADGFWVQPINGEGYARLGCDVDVWDVVDRALGEPCSCLKGGR